jgi:hypothetical protein
LNRKSSLDLNDDELDMGYLNAGAYGVGGGLTNYSGFRDSIGELSSSFKDTMNFDNAEVFEFEDSELHFGVDSTNLRGLDKVPSNFGRGPMSFPSLKDGPKVDLLKFSENLISSDNGDGGGSVGLGDDVIFNFDSKMSREEADNMQKVIATMERSRYPTEVFKSEERYFYNAPPLQLANSYGSHNKYLNFIDDIESEAIPLSSSIPNISPSLIPTGVSPPSEGEFMGLTDDGESGVRERATGGGGVPIPIPGRSSSSDDGRILLTPHSPDSRKKRVDIFQNTKKHQNRTGPPSSIIVNTAVSGGTKIPVKYDVRKNFADRRVRVKGRFVKKGDEELLRELMNMS